MNCSPIVHPRMFCVPFHEGSLCVYTVNVVWTCSVSTSGKTGTYLFVGTSIDYFDVFCQSVEIFRAMAPQMR